MKAPGSPRQACPREPYEGSPLSNKGVLFHGLNPLRYAVSAELTSKRREKSVAIAQTPRMRVPGITPTVAIAYGTLIKTFLRFDQLQNPCEWSHLNIPVPRIVLNRESVEKKATPWPVSVHPWISMGTSHSTVSPSDLKKKMETQQ